MSTTPTEPFLDPEEAQWDFLLGEFEEKRAELWKILHREDERLVREHREWRRQMLHKHGENEHMRGQMDSAWTELCRERKRREKAHAAERCRIVKELDARFEEWQREYYATRRQ